MPNDFPHKENSLLLGKQKYFYLFDKNFASWMYLENENDGRMQKIRTRCSSTFSAFFLMLVFLEICFVKDFGEG